MFEQNVELKQININVFDIRVISKDVQAIFKKYGGLVRVKVTKPQNRGTEAQNKAMHSLLQAYYASNFHNAPEGSTLAFFKVWCKAQWGPCHCMNMDGELFKVPMSWADYDKEQRATFLDSLLSEVKQSGAYNHFEKIRQIVDGMELNK